LCLGLHYQKKYIRVCQETKLWACFPNAPDPYLAHVPNAWDPKQYPLDNTDKKDGISLGYIPNHWDRSSISAVVKNEIVDGKFPDNGFACHCHY
jgi:hypothetical protein